MIRFLKLCYFKLYRVFPRFKLWRICRVLGIRPYKWQKDFALGFMEPLKYPEGRATGKTTAVMLKLLMVYPYTKFDALWILRNDPDFRTDNRARLIWYDGEYKRLSIKCFEAGIPVMMMFHIYDLRGL